MIDFFILAKETADLGQRGRQRFSVDEESHATSMLRTSIWLEKEVFGMLPLNEGINTFCIPACPLAGLYPIILYNNLLLTFDSK